jgi:transcriptional regulator NrdR family protein
MNKQSLIECPTCGAATEVMETRKSPNGIRRRRRCGVDGCDGRITTVEIIFTNETRKLLRSGFSLVASDELEQLASVVSRLRSGSRLVP